MRGAATRSRRTSRQLLADWSTFEPALPLWGVPQLDGLYEGATHRILVTEAGGVRLVIATVDPGSGTPGARDVAAILASIDFEARARFASRSSSSRSTRRLASFPPARA